MSKARSAALRSIVKDAHAKRLGDKLPEDRRKLLGLIKEELEGVEESKDEDTEGTETE